MLIRYNETRKRFEAETCYAERATANPTLKAAGFVFDFNGAKVWHTAGYKNPRTLAEQAAIAAKLSEYLDDDAKQRVGAVAIAKAQGQATARVDALAASRAINSNANIPKPDGLEYLPYQRAGIAYAMQRESVLIADEMGLGKTIQGVGICNADPAARSILIVCPASLKINWRREFTKWDIKGLTVGLADTKVGVPATDVVIVNFDILTKLAGQLRARNWDVLITDECHKVKNPGAQRTQELLGKRTWDKARKVWNIEKTAIAARRRVFLTGTPIVNRPAEFWPFVLALDPNGLGRYKSVYEKRFCAAGFNSQGYWVKDGASNLAELQDRARTSFMVRRLKVDVLKDLPAKRRQVVVLEAPDSLREVLLREKTAYDKVHLNEGNKVAFEEMAAARKEVALAKVPFVLEHLDEVLEETDKVVVMAHHHEVIDAIMAHFGNTAVVVDGRVTNLDKRQAAVDRFQTDPTCKVFVGSILAAGVGLTLTAASTVVFAELDWVPGNITQAEDRCHRIGQVNTVLIQHLVLDSSVDANVVEKIISKQAVIAAALDNITPELVKPQIGANASKPVAPKPQLEITSEQIAAVHNGLRMLASMCDGAREIDGSGFNKFDTVFGKKLAFSASLTEQQALAGRKLVQKYQGQLPTELVVAAGITPMEDK